MLDSAIPTTPYLSDHTIPTIPDHTYHTKATRPYLPLQGNHARARTVSGHQNIYKVSCPFPPVQ
eukprot:2147925-Pyramimonas_sp.AAC.1